MTHKSKFRAGAAAGLGVALALAFPAATPAQAARRSVPQDRAAVLAAWTQPGERSYAAWKRAHEDPGAWADYGFDWSTDSCTDVPDRPLSFDFTLACERHDFGYRNYRLAGAFRKVKPRLDEALYTDMIRQCRTYTVKKRDACLVVALAYYIGVRGFARSAAVTPPR